MGPTTKVTDSKNETDDSINIEHNSLLTQSSNSQAIVPASDFSGKIYTNPNNPSPIIEITSSS